MRSAIFRVGNAGTVSNTFVARAYACRDSSIRGSGVSLRSSGIAPGQTAGMLVCVLTGRSAHNWPGIARVPGDGVSGDCCEHLSSEPVERP